MLLGDTHGDLAWFGKACARAAERGCDYIVQLGDFGYWEHDPKDSWLDDVSAALVAHDLRCIWIDGNHENHELLRKLYAPGGPRHEATDDGLWTIRPNLYHAPRGHRFEIEGRSFLALGGAVSIDRHERVRGASWWPEEALTYEDVGKALDTFDLGRRLDVLLSHDAPMGTPGIPPNSRLDEILCEVNREGILAVVDALRPRMVAHGHYHLRHSTILRRPWGTVEIEGFANEWRRGSWGILHLSSLVVGR
jgi:hypothetical protein